MHEAVCDIRITPLFRDPCTTKDLDLTAVGI